MKFREENGHKDCPHCHGTGEVVVDGVISFCCGAAKPIAIPPSYFPQWMQPAVAKPVEAQAR